MSGKNGNTGPLLEVTPITYSIIVCMFAGTICLVLLAVVGVLCARVALDGDAPLTIQITQQLADLVPKLAAAMVVATIGSRALGAWTAGLAARLGVSTSPPIPPGTAIPPSTYTENPSSVGATLSVSPPASINPTGGASQP